jgi:hypothetical protein
MTKEDKLYRDSFLYTNTNNKYNKIMNRKIKLLPTAFHRFRQVAFAAGVFFICSIQNSEYTVEADDSQLEQLGY